MDLLEALQKLYAEKESLMRAITALEALQSADGATPRRVRSRRGRKSMDPQERQEVSMRMKRYWANRKVPDSEASQS